MLRVLEVFEMRRKPTNQRQPRVGDHHRFGTCSKDSRSFISKLRGAWPRSKRYVVSCLLPRELPNPLRQLSACKSLARARGAPGGARTARQRAPPPPSPKRRARAPCACVLPPPAESAML
eukprot:6195551-Pleurochrysis_carterae.AAC.3